MHLSVRGRWLLGAALVIALVGTSLFTVRAAQRARWIRAGVDEPIRPWMSVPYIARSYDVPPRVLFDALAVEPGTNVHRPLAAIAQEQNRPIVLVMADVRAAIARYRMAAPPAPPSPPRAPDPPAGETP